MKKISLFILALFLINSAVGCADAQNKKSEYEKAPDFTLTDIEGDTFRLSDYSGKVILLNFFGTWCPPCRAEMPDFNEIAKKYKDNVVVVAIALSDNMPSVKKFAEQGKLVFRISLDDGSVNELYGPIRAIPVTVIIDRAFNVKKRYIGSRSKEVFEGDIEELLR
ncbi:MAG: TlpA family protein disulfide reductase [Candidatus Omnitrophica bacterium]|nr:TlpA family protein disulfide reductase [Candidatus Omnitrophota bacterium]